MITLYTIGSSGTAQHFYELLRSKKIKQLLDVRIHHNCQLCGWAKSENMEYLTDKILGIPYRKILDFAPTEDLLRRWRTGRMYHRDYIREYTTILESRKISERYQVRDFDGCCFMCTEKDYSFCHRRLLVEYLKNHSEEDVTICHLQ